MSKLNIPEWEAFEIECTNFLNTTFSNDNLKFKREGGSDSTNLDISIIKGLNEVGKVEAKMPLAQAGQIVVLIEDNKFVYSKDSKSPNNIYVQGIIDYLNDNFKTYSQVGTSSIAIDIDSDIFYSRINEYYSSFKKCNYFITSDPKTKCKAIFKCEDLKKYFDISCVIRRKRSETRDLPKKLYNSHVEIISNRLNNKSINVIGKVSESNKLYLDLDTELDSESQYIATDEADIYLSPVADKTYRVKVRSGTNNPNILFELKLKRNIVENEGIEDFNNYLSSI